MSSMDKWVTWITGMLLESLLVLVELLKVSGNLPARWGCSLETGPPRPGGTTALYFFFSRSFHSCELCATPRIP